MKEEKHFVHKNKSKADGKGTMTGGSKPLPGATLFPFFPKG